MPYIRNKHGEKIYFDLMKKSKTLFVIFHGMFGSSDELSMVKTKEFFSKNYSVLIFDYAGHGKSEGSLNGLTISRIMEDKDIMMRSKASPFDEIYLFGASFGTYPALIEASKNKKVKGVILFNPASDMMKLIFRKETSKDLDNHITAHRTINFPTKILFFFDLLRYNLYEISKKITCPVYVCHVKGDKTVPIKQSKKLEKHLRCKNKFVYPDGEDHGLKEELYSGKYEQVMLPEAVDWIKKNS